MAGVTDDRPGDHVRDDDRRSGARDVGDDLRESAASVADATNPTTDDPFVDLGLVDSDRWAAPGGWRRGLVGVGVGLAAGWVLVAANRTDRRAGRTEGQP